MRWFYQLGQIYFNRAFPDKSGQAIRGAARQMNA